MVKTFMQMGPKWEQFTNSVDIDETPQDAASHQGLRYVEHILGNGGQY